MRIILGSSSIYRRRILEEMGLVFECLSPDIDEKALRCEDPMELTTALARAKAEALRGQVAGAALLITSDQVTVCAGRILEKPADAEEARSFLSMYNTHPAETVTAVRVVNTATGRWAEGVDIARTYFNPFTAADMDKLIADGELFHASGGFLIDSPLWEGYIQRIEGARDSVIGMPKELVRRLLAEAGGE